MIFLSGRDEIKEREKRSVRRQDPIRTSGLINHHTPNWESGRLRLLHENNGVTTS